MPKLAPPAPYIALCVVQSRSNMEAITGDLKGFYDRFCPCGCGLETFSEQMGFLPQGTVLILRGLHDFPLEIMRENRKNGFPARGGMGFLKGGLLF